METARKTKDLNTEVLPSDEKIESRFEIGIENGHAMKPGVIPIKQSPSWVSAVALLENSGWNHLYTTEDGVRVYKTSMSTIEAVKFCNGKVRSVDVTNLFRD